MRDRLRFASFLPAIVAAGLLLLLPSTVRAKLFVMTTTTNLAAIAKEVGGDRIRVEAIAAGYQDPHHVQAKPSFARQINRADLLIANGLELEVGWLPPLLTSARNPRVRPGAPGFLDASRAIAQVLEFPGEQVDRSQGDVHPEGNPHYDLDPRNGLAIAVAIEETLSRNDPDGADVYQGNLDRFRERLLSRIEEWESRAAPLRGSPLVTYHKLWEYLADWLGLRIVDQIENRPGIPPSPLHLKHLVETMQDDRIEQILISPWDDHRVSEQIAKRANARVTILPPSVGAEDSIRTYEELFDSIINRLLGNR